jgi:alcohol dehydrogenase
VARGGPIAAVNPERGRELDYRQDFGTRGRPIIAIPTTAGTGAAAQIATILASA